MGKEKKRKKREQEQIARTRTSVYASNHIGSIGSRGSPGLVSCMDKGVFFGGLDQICAEHYIGMPEGTDGNIIVVGGNGSGKSAGIIKPTLATWSAAICATDIKGELTEFYERFSEELFQQGIIARPYIEFNPIQKDGPAYDPFWWLLHDADSNLVSNINEIVCAIIPIQVDDPQPFWAETERGVLAAAVLYYLKLGLGFSETLSRIAGQTISSLCQELSESDDIRVRMFLGETADMKKEALAAVDRGLRNKIMGFTTDPYISHAFRGEREGATCFNWDHLDTHNIFLRIPAHLVDQWGGAINLMYSQLIRYLERRPEKHSKKGANNIQTLLLMDEFARFGKLENITSAMSTLRSKNVNICLVVQSIAQIDKIYGECDRRIIFDNAQYQVILRANDAETQKLLTELIGTKVRYQFSASQQMDVDKKISGYSIQLGETLDQTVYPHELSSLTDVLVLTPSGFCRAEKFPPGHDSEFILRVIAGRRGNGKEEARVASINDPINLSAWYSREIRKGAKILAIEERAENAQRRVREAQGHSEEDKQETVQEVGSEAFTSRIAKTILQHFPQIWDLEPGFREGTEDWSRPLEDVLLELSNNQREIESLKRKANWPTQGGTDV